MRRCFPWLLVLPVAHASTTLAQAATRIPRLAPPLQNRYFLVRHGQSTSNMEGVISSDPAIGTTQHGLTASGRAQARGAATRLLDLVGRDFLAEGGRLRLVSSDFTRARETAQELQTALLRILAFEDEAFDAEQEGTGEMGQGHLAEAVEEDISLDPRFRERWFGQLDGTPLPNYDLVWPRDLEDPGHTDHEVEAVYAVANRVLTAIGEWEDGTRETRPAQAAPGPKLCVVIVSHADTLQIIQCAVAGADLGRFSQYRFRNGEVREIFDSVHSLPDPVPLTFR